MQIEIEPVGIDKAEVVQKIFEASPAYFRNTAQSKVLPHFAVKEMTEGPPPERQSPTYKKIFCLVRVDGSAVGVVDLHKDHPAKHLCYIGLLLLEESQQGHGLGKIVYSHVERFVKSELQCSKLVLGISQDNDVEGFWAKNGFVRNGRSYVYASEGHDNEVYEMEKALG